VADDRLDRRDELDGRGAGADHGDALAGQVDVVVPARGVERRTREGLDAGHVGQRRLDQPAAAADQRVGRQRAPAGLQPPEHRGVVPHTGHEVGVDVQVRAHAKVVGDLLQVRPDLRLPAVDVRPVRVRREGEGVEVARHVAGAAGIGVVAPGAADAAGALQQDEVLDPPPLEGHRGADPGEPAADDGNPHVRRQRPLRDVLLLLHLCGHRAPSSVGRAKATTAERIFAREVQEPRGRQAERRATGGAPSSSVSTAARPAA
jgi:hypothetical protein